MIFEKEKKICQIIQGDLPLTLHPFKALKMSTGLREEEILDSIKGLIKKGIIRKFGAIIYHHKAGYSENAMVVWAVPDDQQQSVGKLLASFTEITHCYERTPPFKGKYTIFSMVHFHAGERENILRKLSEATGIRDFEVLDTEEEYKKTSMEYF
jgi:DNA-binding Lrp family transcriptional regulator